MSSTILMTGTLVTRIGKSAVGGGTPDTSQPYRVAARVAVCAGAAIGTLLLRAGLAGALSGAAAEVLAGIGGYVARPASRRGARTAEPSASRPRRRR